MIFSGKRKDSEVQGRPQPNSNPIRAAGGTVGRWLLLAAGVLSTALAVVGIFLPLLPTVPLLLLAAACFARSSERFHRLLLEHDRLGPMLRPFLGGAGIPRRARNTALAMIWVAIPATAFFLVPLAWVRFLLLAIALCVTVYLLRLPTAPSG